MQSSAKPINVVGYCDLHFCPFPFAMYLISVKVLEVATGFLYLK